MVGHIILHTDVDPIAGENEKRYEGKSPVTSTTGTRENTVDSDAIEDTEASLRAPFEYVVYCVRTHSSAAISSSVFAANPIFCKMEVNAGRLKTGSEAS